MKVVLLGSTKKVAKYFPLVGEEIYPSTVANLQSTEECSHWTAATEMTQKAGMGWLKTAEAEM